MKKTLAILAVSPMLCAHAWAGPVQQRQLDTPYLDGGQVRTSGQEHKFGAVRGAGQDMPLYKALQAIIPRGYTVRTVGVERWLLDEPVSWTAGNSWTEVLSEAISPYPELVVDIATGSKVVILRQAYSSNDGSPASYAAAYAPPTAAPVPAPVRQSAAPAPVKTEVQLAAAPAAPAAAAVKRAQAVPATIAEKPTAPDAGPYMDMPRPIPKADKPAVEHAPKADVIAVAAPAPQPAERKISPEAAAFIAAAAAELKAEAAKAEAAKPAVKAEPATPATKPAAEPKPAQLALKATPEAAPPKPAPAWQVASDDKTIKSTLTRWATSAGWQVSWELGLDYPVDAHASIPGTFEDAVSVVVKSMENAEAPMKAIFYSGNKVLRIVAKGVE